ncbi:MAG: hypothetical protein HC882_03470 [Acidobacteria bacterium]|nr:hypothetical protein [Acidobacteriota bacterium]
MMSITTSRRVHPRYSMDAGTSASVEFVFPFPGGHHCSMKLRDISASGLSFMLDRPMPGLEAGDSIDRVTVRVGELHLHGDLLVMHLTPDASPGSACGALFYPRGDRNIIALQRLIDRLERNVSD